MEGKFAHQDEF